MSEITIRQLHADEAINVVHSQDTYAFQATPPLPRKEKWLERMRSHLDHSRHWGLFEDGQVRANLSYVHMSQHIRGKIYPATGAIWGVATHPEGRRKGYARRLLEHVFQAMHSDGLPFSTLYAFRESFYMRLGFATFPQVHVVRFPVQPLLPLLKQKFDGRVKLSLLADNVEEYRNYLSKQQHKIHGMGVFPLEILRGNDEYWLAVAYRNNEPCGIMIYKMQLDKQTMEVPHFYYDDSTTRYLLLEWFARHADQVSTIELRLPPTELPETWYPDLVIQRSSLDAPLGRVIDVREMSGVKVGTGEFSVRMSDPHCPRNEGIYRFACNGGVLEVNPAEKAECDLSIQALSALIYGTHDPEIFAFRGWGNPAPQMQETMRQMFPAMVPHLHERF